MTNKKRWTGDDDRALLDAEAAFRVFDKACPNKIKNRTMNSLRTRLERLRGTDARLKENRARPLAGNGNGPLWEPDAALAAKVAEAVKRVLGEMKNEENEKAAR